MNVAFEEFIEEYHQANSEFVRGNRAPLQRLFSHADDVTLLNPFGSLAHGWEEVSRTQEASSAGYRGSDGEVIGFERITSVVTPELAFIVEVERYSGRIGGGSEIEPFGRRATTIFRLEDGTWTVMHRHADSITAPRAPESIALTTQSPADGPSRR